MPEFFELSAYQTSAKDFFETLKAHNADLVLDVRLKNSNQLCGFTKRKDLEYLVPQLTGAAYVHDLTFAPSPDLLDSYIHHRIDWNEYKNKYLEQMADVDAVAHFKKEYSKYKHVCILGTATKKRRSHSEALSELLHG